MEKKKKKIHAYIPSFLIVFALLLQLGWSMTAHAAEGNVMVALSSDSVAVGETVTITASSYGPNGAKASSTMEISYDTSVFSFVKCSADNYSGGDGGTVSSTASSYSITLKAISTGTVRVKVTGSGGKISETQEALSAMEAAGASISVGGGTVDTSSDTPAADSTKSADNSLSQLKLSKGTLSPGFQYSTTSYTATVTEDVTSIEVDAKPSNAKAEIESITGNTDLQPGKNTIKITVKAENGSKVVYTVVVTKSGTAVPDDNATEGEDDSTVETPDAEVTEEGIVIGGIAYEVTGEFSDEAIPDGFAKETLTWQGQEVNGAKFSNGDLWLLYLTSEDENAKKGFYVYESAANLFQPLIRLNSVSSASSGGSGKYIIPLPAASVGDVPAGYVTADVTIGETENISVYTYGGSNDVAGIEEFYLVYGVDSEGSTGWYRYDSVESTTQRYIESYAYSESGGDDEESTGAAYLQAEYKKLDEKYTKEKSSSRRTIIILIFVIAVLIIAIINILLLKSRKAKETVPFFKRKRERDIWDDDHGPGQEEAPRGKFMKSPVETPEEENETEEFYDEDIKEEEEEYNHKERYPEPPDRAIEKEDDLEIIDLNDL